MFAFVKRFVKHAAKLRLIVCVRSLQVPALRISYIDIGSMIALYLTGTINLAK
ncbi:hypothetical protein PUN28_001298 [Cardiocondyla obscurior]|uniref:Uncharacterized protein n=1 Tax=Cardiocondyla obscurior TaxID=286306 RepID=A0AAW2H4D7_9HYME